LRGARNLANPWLAEDDMSEESLTSDELLPENAQARPGADPDFRPLAEARRLLRSVRAGTLATLNGSGDPFASLVSVATDPDGSPLILVSQLSSHTRHLDKDARMSLLLADSGEGDPLANPRLTITGKAEKVTDPAMRAGVRDRFLAKHPKAALYADFGDFSFWRIAMDQVHLNGGFARAARFPAKRLLIETADATALLASEGGAVAHMNADHADALALYAEVLAGQQPGPWQATGLDPEGMDLACGDRTARLVFPQRVTNPGDLRKTLVALANSARSS
jgi:putative heme iron utilization protein